MLKIETEETIVIVHDSWIRKFFLKLGGALAVVLHPVFLFFYCFLFIQFTMDFQKPADSVWFVVYVFGLSVFLPALFSLLYSGDPYLNNRRKRPLVILFTFICYAVLTYIVIAIGGTISILKLIFHTIRQEEITRFIIYFHLLIFLMAGMVLLFIISFWYKISLHANGIGFLFALVFMPGLSLILQDNVYSEPKIFISATIFAISCLILLWQRVASGAHKLIEVITGLALGFGITILMETLLR